MPAAPVRLCGVCDGAAWRGQQGQALCPHARQGLDDSHGAQSRQRVATAHSGASGQAVEWVAATMTRLSLGNVGLVLGGVQRMQAQSDAAAQAMATGWDSLHAHRGRTTARQLRRGGSPLGSGGIESSNTGIGHGRLQRSGAWGDESNSNQRLARRCAQYNSTLAQVFVRYQQR